MGQDGPVLVADVVAGLSALIWVVLAAGRSWTTAVRLPPPAPPARWPGVVAVVPARDEAEILPTTLPTLVGQDYPGPFRVLLVDDDSTDATGAVAAAAGAEVVRGSGPPPGWAGKVAAMATGLAAAGEPDDPDGLVLFTDADIAYPPGALTGLVTAMGERVLVSQMVRLRAESFWERAIVPAFVYFFAQLYPFRRVNGRGRVAAAAGGCLLVRRDALVAAGGLAMIRDALIDDVSLGRLLKTRGRIWLGLSSTIESVRPYPQLADLWRMVARSAYTQLRYSPLLLAGTVVGLLLTYVVPPAALVAGLLAGDPLLASLGGATWLLMAATYVPMLRFYRQPSVAALGLPVVAALYAAMTLDSARRHRLGRGGAWKGRVRAGSA
jgi:hopene-associated glycosyltransferase HpnB